MAVLQPKEDMISTFTSHSRHSRPARLSASLVAALVALIFPFASSAAGHSALQGSNPKDGAEISKMPAKVEFTLNEEVLQPASVVVSSSDGKRINSEETTVDGKTVTTQITAEAPPGKYTAAYRIVSTDAHPINSKISFEVAGTPTPTEPTATPITPTSSVDATIEDMGEPSANWDQLFAVAFAAILAVGVIIFMVKGVRARDDE